MMTHLSILLPLLAQASTTGDGSGAAAGILGIFAGMWIFVLLLGIAATIFWIWMLIDALTNARLAGTEKLVWVLVILFGHGLGALIYFVVGRAGKTST